MSGSFLADAAATATCNLIKSRDDFKKGIRFAQGIPGVFGAMIILGDSLASWGEIEIKRH